MEQFVEMMVAACKGVLEAIATILGALAWPIVVGATIFFLRDELKELFRKLKYAKIFGQELGFDSSSAPSADEFKTKRRRRTPSEMRPIERKILNTLFTKQVNKWPKFDTLWLFRIEPLSQEYSAYLEAKLALIQEGLIYEGTDGNHWIALTHEGFKYCLQYYDEFPDKKDQWWDSEQMNPDKLKQARESQPAPDHAGG